MEEETEEAEGQDDPKKENDAMAQTTWSQAHRTTQLVKKDRGFGKAVGKSGKASSASDGCHICGHPGHYARDCPDKFAPKGKGDAFTKGKGKNYGKGGKNAYYVEDLYYMKGKFGGGKRKGKSKNKGKTKANAYVMEYDDYGYGCYVLDFPDNHLDLHAAAREPDPSLGQRSVTTANKTKTSPALGMLDTGATCSAGPESSIKNMVNALLQQDKSAKITLDGKSCPRFRYGSGTWGRALYPLTMESSLSGRRFQAFAWSCWKSWTMV